MAGRPSISPNIKGWPPTGDAEQEHGLDPHPEKQRQIGRAMLHHKREHVADRNRFRRIHADARIRRPYQASSLWLADSPHQRGNDQSGDSYHEERELPAPYGTDHRQRRRRHVQKNLSDGTTYDQGYAAPGIKAEVEKRYGTGQLVLWKKVRKHRISRGPGARLAYANADSASKKLPETLGESAECSRKTPDRDPDPDDSAPALEIN